jgi:ribosomal protein L30E
MEVKFYGMHVLALFKIFKTDVRTLGVLRSKQLLNDCTFKLVIVCENVHEDL